MDFSYVQADKHGITIYTTYISVGIAHHEIIRAKVGKVRLKSSHDMCRCQMVSYILVCSL